DEATPFTLGDPKYARFSECRLVTGLLPCRTYYFAIKTMDEVGNWSGISNVASAITLCQTSAARCASGNPDVVAPAAVNLLVATPNGVGTTSIAVSWTAPGDDSITGTATEYDLRYSTSTIT